MGEGELLVGHGGRHLQVDYLHLHWLQGAEVPGKRGKRKEHTSSHVISFPSMHTTINRAQ